MQDLIGRRSAQFPLWPRSHNINTPAPGTFMDARAPMSGLRSYGRSSAGGAQVSGSFNRPWE